MVHIHIYTFSTKNVSPFFFLMLVLVVSSLLIKEMD